MIKKISLYYTAGSVGAFANSLAVWAFGIMGISASLGVSIAPTLSASWLYPRLVWGGLWGLSYIFFQRKMKNLLLKCFFFSLTPTLVQLLLVFPYKASKGFLGADLG